MKRLGFKLLFCAAMAVSMAGCDGCGGGGDEDLCTHAKAYPENFKAYMERLDNPQIVDYRKAEEFAKGHIPGAVNIPVTVQDLDGTKGNCPYVKMVLEVFDVNQPILVYGGDTGFGVNGQAVPGQLACKFGEKNVTLLVGGYKAWVEAGYPTE